MDVSIEKNGAKTLVKLVGRLDTTNADQFQSDIAPLMADAAPDFELDCTDMEYTSSQGQDFDIRWILIICRKYYA